MGKLAVVVGAVLMAVAGLAGVVGALAEDLAGRPTAVAVSSPGCVDVVAAVSRSSDGFVLDVHGRECRVGSRAGLEAEFDAFARLGVAAWRTPGPPLAMVAITLDRSAERPDGVEPPRTLVLTGAEAAAKWGPRPSGDGADGLHRTLMASSATLWVSGYCGIGLLASALCVGLARAVQRGTVGVVWIIR